MLAGDRRLLGQRQSTVLLQAQQAGQCAWGGLEHCWFYTKASAKHALLHFPHKDTSTTWQEYSSAFCPGRRHTLSLFQGYIQKSSREKKKRKKKAQNKSCQLLFLRCVGQKSWGELSANSFLILTVQGQDFHAAIEICDPDSLLS